HCLDPHLGDASHVQQPLVREHIPGLPPPPDPPSKEQRDRRDDYRSDAGCPADGNHAETGDDGGGESDGMSPSNEELLLVGGLVLRDALPSGCPSGKRPGGPAPPAGRVKSQRRHRYPLLSVSVGAMRLL